MILKQNLMKTKLLQIGKTMSLTEANWAMAILLIGSLGCIYLYATNFKTMPKFGKVLLRPNSEQGRNRG